MNRGDIYRWQYLPGFGGFGDDMSLKYWAKARTAIVLADGRLVDTWSHNLNDTEHRWNHEHEVVAAHVVLTFLINVGDLVPVDGPKEQYEQSDLFSLNDGGGGTIRNFMRKGATPKPELIRALLQRRLGDAEWEEGSALRTQERIKKQLSDFESGKAIRL